MKLKPEKIKDFFGHENSSNFRWKRLVFVVFLISIFLISGCNIGKKDTKKSLEEIRTGTEGITVSFLPNAPPDTIHVEQSVVDNTFDVILELKNKGAYPQPDESPKLEGSVYLSGFDPKIITFKVKGDKSEDLGRMSLEGKSSISPNGGQDILGFEGKVIGENLNVEKYEPTLLATACYRYFTVAEPQVCIDPNPYSTIKENKVCTVQGLTLSSQGAPIAVTKIDEEAFSTKTQFRITFKNVGNGDVIKTARDSFEKCKSSGSERLGREDMDKVFVWSVKISDKELECGPFSDGAIKSAQGYTRLINGEGSIICELPKADYGTANTAYTTPLKIELRYAYRNTAQKKILIKKEGGSLIGGVSDGGSEGISIPSPPSPQETQTITV